MDWKRLDITAGVSWRTGVLLTVTLLAGGMAGAVGVAAVATHGDSIGVGDFVSYHFSAYNLDGDLVFTTDPALAKVELAGGNAHIEPNLSAPVYSIRSGFIELNPDDTGEEKLDASRTMLGHKEGDVITLPYVVGALGEAQISEVPLIIGPVMTDFTLNLTELYNETNRVRTTAQHGDISVFQVGRVLPYASVLEATVLKVENGIATLRANVEMGERVYSKALGFNFTIAPAPGDETRVILRADIAEGETFTTRGCKLPLTEIMPGRYRVETISNTSMTVKEAPLRIENVLDETLSVEIQIIEVDKAKPVLREAKWLASMVGFTGTKE